MIYVTRTDVHLARTADLVVTATLSVCKGVRWQVAWILATLSERFFPNIRNPPLAILHCCEVAASWSGQAKRSKRIDCGKWITHDHAPVFTARNNREIIQKPQKRVQRSWNGGLAQNVVPMRPKNWAFYHSTLGHHAGGRKFWGPPNREPGTCMPHGCLWISRGCLHWYLTIQPYGFSIQRAAGRYAQIERKKTCHGHFQRLMENKQIKLYATQVFLPFPWRKHEKITEWPLNSWTDILGYIYIWTILDQYPLQQRIWLPGVFTMSWASPGHVLPYNSCVPWHRSPKCSLCLSSIEWKPKKLATVSKQFLMQHLQLELLNKAWSATVPLQNALIEFRSRRSRLLWSC